MTGGGASDGGGDCAVAVVGVGDQWVGEYENEEKNTNNNNNNKNTGLDVFDDRGPHCNAAHRPQRRQSITRL